MKYFFTTINFITWTTKGKDIHAFTHIKNVEFFFTYTSTSTGNAASLSSSRQLGGNSICTAARVPCVNEISNERIDGSASD